MGLNRTSLKYLAAAAMLLDHIAAFVLMRGNEPGLYDLFRLIGRLTAPVMCYFLAAGFQHTSSLKRYVLRLAVFAAVSQPAFVFARFGAGWPRHLFSEGNMLMTLLLSLLMLAGITRAGTSAGRIAAAAGAVLLSLFCDWGGYGPLMVLVFYMLRSQPKKMWLTYSLLAVCCWGGAAAAAVSSGEAWYLSLWNGGMLLVVPLLKCYDGTRGSGSKFNKWFFYVFYPAHLAVLGGIRFAVA